MTGHIRIVNDPVDLVPLLITFHNATYKKIYDLLTHAWMTEEELCARVPGEDVESCLAILKKGSLVEEKWRMPLPGQKPSKEYRATYNKFRASFQCNFSDLADLIFVAVSNDEYLRELVERVEGELRSGNTSVNDIARKFGVNPIFIRGLAKRIPHLDLKGQGLVLLEGERH